MPLTLPINTTINQPRNYRISLIADDFFQRARELISKAPPTVLIALLPRT